MTSKRDNVYTVAHERNIKKCDSSPACCAGRLDPDEIVAAANQAGKQLGIDEVVCLRYA